MRSKACLVARVPLVLAGISSRIRARRSRCLRTMLAVTSVLLAHTLVDAIWRKHSLLFVQLVAQHEPVDRRRSKEVMDIVMYSPEAITVTFNLARLRESQGLLTDAMAIYHVLIQKYQHYTACKSAFGYLLC